VASRQFWVGVEDGRSVGLVSVECYTDRSAEVAIVIDPGQRGRGLCPQLVRAVLESAEMKEMDLIRAAIDVDNRASIRCFESAGFLRLSDEPDDEHNLTFLYRRQ
jgi:L-amino acid N-acyltransferase YncA